MTAEGQVRSQFSLSGIVVKVSVVQVVRRALFLCVVTSPAVPTHLSLVTGTLETIEDLVTSHSCDYLISHTAEFRRQVTTHEINLEINKKVQN